MKRQIIVAQHWINSLCKIHWLLSLAFIIYFDNIIKFVRPFLQNLVQLPLWCDVSRNITVLFRLCVIHFVHRLMECVSNQKAYRKGENQRSMNIYDEFAVYLLRDRNTRLFVFNRLSQRTKRENDYRRVQRECIKRGVPPTSPRFLPRLLPTPWLEPPSASSLPLSLFLLPLSFPCHKLSCLLSLVQSIMFAADVLDDCAT